MNPREKKLAIVVGVLAGVALCLKVVYPAVIKPVVDIGDELAALEGELFEYQEEADRIEEARLDYKRFVERTGSTDLVEVHNQLQKQLEALARKAKLEQPAITVRKALTERGIGLHRLPVVIGGEGTLRQTIEFLESCYELPYVARFKDLKFDPITKSRRKGSNADSDRIKLTATMEVAVLPADSKVRLNPEALEQPDSVVKHAADSYAMIWERAPFSEYVKPTKPPPKPPTPKPKEPKPEPVKAASPPKGDKDARHKKVVMALSYGVDELLVVNEQSKTQEYVATGEELDGGELVLVHPYGGVVRKERGEFFYEVGTLLSEAIPVSVADDYPEIQALTQRLRKESNWDSPQEHPPKDGAGPNDEVAAEQEPDQADEPTGEEESVDLEETPRQDEAAEPEGPASKRSRATDRPKLRKPRKVAPPKAKNDGRSARSRLETKPTAGAFRAASRRRDSTSNAPDSDAARPTQDEPNQSNENDQEPDENEDAD